MAQLVGVSSCNRRVTGSISSPGTYPACRFDPWSGCVQEGSWSMLLSHIDVSLSLPFLSLKAMKKKCPLVRILKIYWKKNWSKNQWSGTGYGGPEWLISGLGSAEPGVVHLHWPVMFSSSIIEFVQLPRLKLRLSSRSFLIGNQRSLRDRVQATVRMGSSQLR